MNRVYPAAIALVAAGLVRPGEVVSRVIPLGDVGEALAIAARREGHKVIVRPDR